MTSSSVRSEHPQFSRSEKVKRIRNCAMAIKQGASRATLTRESKRYTNEEYDAAVRMLDEVKAKKSLGA